jgi:hypothetical protein
MDDILDQWRDIYRKANGVKAPTITYADGWFIYVLHEQEVRLRRKGVLSSIRDLQRKYEQQTLEQPKTRVWFNSPPLVIKKGKKTK